MRGPKSRAGLIAYPVVAPSERPIPQTKDATRYGPSPAPTPLAETSFEKIAAITNTSTRVARISLTRFHAALRIAGAVQNMASFAAGSGVSFQCGPYCSQTRIAPAKAPKSSARAFVARLA